MSSSDEEQEPQEDEEEGEDDVEEEDDQEEEPSPEPIVLPDRATRGRRMNALLQDEDSADEEFWGQEFFKDEARDEEYSADSDDADVIDTDFDESEESEDEEGQDDDDERERPRKKVLKPPGAAKKPSRPVRAAQAVPRGTVKPAGAAAGGTAEGEVFQAPTLRKSTRERVQEAEKERARAEQVRPKRRRAAVGDEAKPLTQEELLAEAARTERENLRSLQIHMAMEEEMRKRLERKKKAAYTGPLIKFCSRRVGGEQLTTLEIMNMQPPPGMLPQQAPPPAERHVCVITGLSARYRDPETGMPYANLEAFRELRRRRYTGLGVKRLTQLPQSQRSIRRRPSKLLGDIGPLAVDRTPSSSLCAGPQEVHSTQLGAPDGGRPQPLQQHHMQQPAPVQPFTQQPQLASRSVSQPGISTPHLKVELPSAPPMQHAVAAMAPSQALPHRAAPAGSAGPVHALSTAGVSANN